MRIITTSFHALLCICFIGCKARVSPEAKRIKNADIVEVFYRAEDGRSYIHRTASDTLIQDFIKVFNGDVEQANCPLTGEIKFYSKDSLLLEGKFSINNGNCQYFIKDDKAWKLTYNVGMYLSEEFHYLKNN